MRMSAVDINSPRIAPEERRRKISEAAYYRAQQRGFVNGDPLEDWLAAEAEIDDRLRLEGVELQERKEEERAAYESVRRRLQSMLSELRGSVSAAGLREMLERATREAREAGGFTADAVGRAGQAVRRDLASSIERLQPHWETLAERTTGLLDVWRNRSSEFLGSASSAAVEWLHQFRTRQGEQLYHAGDVAPAGAYECCNCAQPLTLNETGPLSPCRRCGQKAFRRISSH